jgi:Domain of unknown function (DUF4129)
MARFRPGGLRISGDVRRPAAVAVLLGIAAVGLRSRGAFSAAGIPAAAGVAGHAADVVFGILEGLVALACVAVLVFLSRLRYRKRSPEDQRVEPELSFPWWVRPLALLTALALLAVPVVLIVFTSRDHPARSAAPAGRVPAAGRAAASAARGAAHGAAHPGAAGTGLSWWLLAGMAIAGVAALVVAFAAWRRPRPEPAAPARPVPAEPALAAAAAAGTAALRGPGDPRAGIIACYAAMEHSLAGAGAAPAVSDTPGEVLARASAGGLVRSAAASLLTELFRRARYSDHAIDEADRRAALAALDEIRADLDGAGRLPAGAGRGG